MVTKKGASVTTSRFYELRYPIKCPRNMFARASNVRNIISPLLYICMCELSSLKAREKYKNYTTKNSRVHEPLLLHGRYFNINNIQSGAFECSLIDFPR